MLRDSYAFAYSIVSSALREDDQIMLGRTLLVRSCAANAAMNSLTKALFQNETSQTITK